MRIIFYGGLERRPTRNYELGCGRLILSRSWHHWLVAIRGRVVRNCVILCDHGGPIDPAEKQGWLAVAVSICRHGGTGRHGNLPPRNRDIRILKTGCSHSKALEQFVSEPFLFPHFPFPLYLGTKSFPEIFVWGVCFDYYFNSVWQF